MEFLILHEDKLYPLVFLQSSGLWYGVGTGQCLGKAAFDKKSAPTLIYGYVGTVHMHR